MNAMMDSEPVNETDVPAVPPEPQDREDPPTPFDVQPDNELVRAARNGDMAAYDQLIRRYQERVYATIYHMTSNHEDANDLAQETFIKAYSALKSERSRVMPSFDRALDQYFHERESAPS